MKIIPIILLIIFVFQNKNYQYNNGIPTKYGIQHYINLNKEIIVKEFEEYVHQKLYSYDIKIEDLHDYQDYDTLEAGRFYRDDEIIITNELKYLDYELSFMPKYIQKQYKNNNKFVKAVVIHELSHLYFYEIINEMLNDEIRVCEDYYINNKRKTNADFIEEGLCEYIVCKMKQSICSDYKPKTLEEIRDNNNKYLIKYVYSRVFLTKFLDEKGLKQGLYIILTNEAPTDIEILYPELYYNRLRYY